MTIGNHQPNIYWLASYPKSGNTWTRAFIANLLNESSEPVDINELNTGAIASSREWVESELDFDIDELSHDEVDRLRPTAYRSISNHLETPEYHKIHDAYTYLPNGEPLIPAEATKGVLCIIRNPLDIAISFANHCSCSINQSIENMNNPKFAFCNSTKHLSNQLRQWLLSWSEHVTSWVEASGLNIKVVRYEDMKQRQFETFTEIASFLELPDDTQSVTDALEQCAMEKLQAQERDNSFVEKSPKVKNFFRKGIVGDWQITLSEEQIDRIINDHHLVMQRFGYLDENRQPTELITLK